MKRASVRTQPPRRQANHLPLRLVHHRHTLKLVHRHHTSYPALLLLVAISMVFSFALTTTAKGVDFSVTAVVPAEKLTKPATINAPVSGASAINANLKMSGSCQPSSYVKIYRDIDFAGAALCQANGTWRSAVTLKPGTNQLSARAYNLTDVEGPRSAAIVVTYKGAAADSQALIIGGDYSYQSIRPGADVRQSVQISGGTAPYAVSFDWGDDKQSLQSQPAAGAAAATHTYEKAGPDNNGYTTTVTATDADGREAKMELISAVLREGVLPASPSASQTNYFATLTPVYLVVLVALVSFWLGEQREIAVLKQKAALRQPGRLVLNR